MRHATGTGHNAQAHSHGVLILILIHATRSSGRVAAATAPSCCCTSSPSSSLYSHHVPNQTSPLTRSAYVSHPLTNASSFFRLPASPHVSQTRLSSCRPVAAASVVSRPSSAEEEARVRRGPFWIGKSKSGRMRMDGAEAEEVGVALRSAGGWRRARTERRRDVCLVWAWCGVQVMPERRRSETGVGSV